jgi:hypothetical protein
MTRKGERVAGNEVMDPIPDLNGDLALKQQELLVLACVEVQRKPHPERSALRPTPTCASALRRGTRD